MSTVTRVFFRPLALVLLVAAVAVGCDTAPGPSLYDPIKDGTYQPPSPDPSLTGISPASGEALAGVTELTLTGQNFVPSPESTFVYFNGVRQPLRSITKTEIRLLAPNMPKVPLQVKVSVLRAENFSETIGGYRLLPAVERVGALESDKRPYAVTTDLATKRIFVSLLDIGIDVIDADSLELRSTSVPVSFKMDDMDYADDYLYTARGVNAVFKFKVPGGRQEVVASVSDRSVSMQAVEYDADGYIWAGGTKSSDGDRFLYRFDANRAVQTFPFAGTIRSIESVPGFLYVLAERNGQSGVWRFTRANGTLGAEEQVLSLGGTYAATGVRSFALTAEGGFVLGTDHADPLLYARPGGEVVPLLAGLLKGTINSMTWLPDGRLIVSGAAAVGNADSEKVGTDLLVVTTQLAPLL